MEVGDLLLINDELKFVCWEAKFLKKPQAFNFNRIEKHQSFYLKEYSKFIRSNYGEKSLYNGDFISFVIFLNGKKELTAESDEMFKDYSFKNVFFRVPAVAHRVKDPILSV